MKRRKRAWYAAAWQVWIFWRKADPAPARQILKRHGAENFGGGADLSTGERQIARKAPVEQAVV